MLVRCLSGLLKLLLLGGLRVEDLVVASACLPLHTVVGIAVHAVHQVLGLHLLVVMARNDLGVHSGALLLTATLVERLAVALAVVPLANRLRLQPGCLVQHAMVTVTHDGHWWL